MTRLEALARRPPPSPGSTPEASVCELCAEPLEPDHRHLLDLDTGEPQCACRACRILFDRGEAGGDHYRLIPERRLRLDGLDDGDRVWAGFDIPVDLAFLTHETRAGRIVARYPGAVGLMTATPAPDAWDQALAAVPALATLEPDVETLLVNRARGAREHWIVPIDDAYRLAARVREHWTGFGGGDAVWDQIDDFFHHLEEAA